MKPLDENWIQLLSINFIIILFNGRLGMAFGVWRMDVDKLWKKKKNDIHKHNALGISNSTLP